MIVNRAIDHYKIDVLLFGQSTTTVYFYLAPFLTSKDLLLFQQFNVSENRFQTSHKKTLKFIVASKIFMFIDRENDKFVQK